MAGFPAGFADLVDPRRGNAQRHELDEIGRVVRLAMVSGAETRVDTAPTVDGDHRHVENQLRWLRPRPFPGRRHRRGSVTRPQGERPRDPRPMAPLRARHHPRQSRQRRNAGQDRARRPGRCIPPPARRRRLVRWPRVHDSDVSSGPSVAEFFAVPEERITPFVVFEPATAVEVPRGGLRRDATRA